MVFISEKVIDNLAEELEGQSGSYEQLINNFQESQPAIMAYILSGDTLFLTQEEREHFLYLSLIIWETTRRKKPELPIIDAQAIEKAEDKNWTQLEAVKARTFRERMDVFFEKYPQEDLLAFVEDALIPDDESPITKEGREPLFVALKTIIDVIAV